MKKTILTMNKKEVEIERMKLINEGYLEDSSYHLEKLLREALDLLNKGTIKRG